MATADAIHALQGHPCPNPGESALLAASWRWLDVGRWINRQQQLVIEYLQEEIRVLKEKLGFGDML